MTTPENYMTIAEAASQAVGRPSSACVWRWARRGVLAKNGKRVKLRHIRAGARLYIPQGALDEFTEALAAADAEHFDKPSSAPEPPQATPSEIDAPRARGIQESSASLARRGIAVGSGA
jgi:hypothetical protein